MAFTANMAIPDADLKYFKNLVTELKTKFPVPAGKLTRIYLHWTVAPHGIDFVDYNLEVVLRNNKLGVDVTGNPQDNVAGMNNNTIHSHTWHRNTNAIGISIDGMDGATVNNFGPDAPSDEEILFLCGAAAAVCKAYEIDASGFVLNGENHADNNGNNINTKGEHNILTHGECAVIDAYPTERWDLGVLAALPKGESLTPAMRTASGDILRAAIHRIKGLL